MKHHAVLQGSKDWFTARMGIPTASEFDKILTPKTLTLSTQHRDYLCRLLAEWALGTPFEVETKVWAMDRGIELEAEAVQCYEFLTGVQTTDDGKVGASPDRFAGDEGLVEIKCPFPHTHISYLLADAVPTDYLLQLQGQLYVTEKKWVDFFSYYPGLPPLRVRTEPEEKRQDAIKELVHTTFCDLLDSCKKILKTKME